MARKRWDNELHELILKTQADIKSVTDFIDGLDVGPEYQASLLNAVKSCMDSAMASTLQSDNLLSNITDVLNRKAK